MSVDPVSEVTKVCPDCAETIKEAAKVCRYCRFRFDAQLDDVAASPDIALGAAAELVEWAHPGTCISSGKTGELLLTHWDVRFLGPAIEDGWVVELSDITEIASDRGVVKITTRDGIYACTSDNPQRAASDIAANRMLDSPGKQWNESAEFAVAPHPHDGGRGGSGIGGGFGIGNFIAGQCTHCYTRVSRAASRCPNCHMPPFNSRGT